MKSSKILHICNAYQTNKLYQLLFDELQLLDCNQEVIAPGYMKSGDSVCNGVKVHYFLRKDKGLQRLFFRRKISKINKFVEDNVDITSFQLIHAHTLFSDGLVAYKLYIKYKIPYVVAVRNSDIEYFFKYLFWLRPLGEEILKESKSIFFISHSNYTKCLRIMPKELIKQISSKIHILPNGINQIWLDKITIKDKKNVLDSVNLVYCGDFCANKNILNIARAVKKIANKGYGVNFIAIGLKENESSSYIRKLLKYQARNVFFKIMKRQPFEKLIDIYRNSDVFIMPSHNETFGLVYIEALTQGLPLIYTKNQGIDGTFPEGFIGYSVNPNDIDEISDAILKTINNYQELVSNIKLIDFDNFDWNSIAKRYYLIYKTIF